VIPVENFSTYRLQLEQKRIQKIKIVNSSSATTILELDLHSFDGKANYCPNSLLKACEFKYCEVVEFLLRYGAAVDKSNGAHETPLTIACERGHLQIAQILLKNGANINKPSYLGRTALSLACQGGYLEIISLLLKYGAECELFF